MIIKQIRSTDGTGSLCYIVANEISKVAAVIDPNIEDIDAILKEVKSLGVVITHLVDTHTHADHISGIRRLKELTNAEAIMHEEARNKYTFVDQGDAFGIGDTLRENVRVQIDRYVKDNDTINVGDIFMNVLYTPGHANDHLSLLAKGHLFTGDLLLIGQAGRSDLPSGNTDEQYDSLFTKILSLPDETIIHPGHDYEGNEFTTLAIEKKTNPFLAPRSKSEYREFVNEFFPPLADADGEKMILQCGVKRITDTNEGFSNITPEELKRMMSANSDLVLLDVREPRELARFGAIEGVINIPVSTLVRGGSEIESNKEKTVIAICQTGGRSVEASHYLVKKGFKQVYNLLGGTLAYLKSEKFTMV